MRSLFLAAMLAVAYALLRGWPAELHAVLRACVAVLVLVLGVGLWRKREQPHCSRARSARRARWPDYVAIGLGVLSVECLFLFFLTATPPRAENLAYALEATLLPERATTRNESAGGPGDTATDITGNWLWNSQGQRTLPLRTSARPSNKPEVFVRPGDDVTTAELLKRPYIRAFALEKFRDSTWAPLAVEATALEADPGGWIRFARPPSRRGPILRCEVFHAVHPGGQDVLTAPQGVYEINLPELRRVAPGILRLNPLSNPGRGYNYRTVSQTVSLDSLLEGGAPTGTIRPTPNVPEHLLELPENEELRQAIIDVAIRTQGPLAVRLRGLQRHLQKSYEYSLTVENEAGHDPLLNFLVHEKRGHCEFFATAGALFCRALGLPARVAYGWTGGRYYDAPSPLFLFRAREAHAWTEIFLPDIGWVVFDPTPPSAQVHDIEIAEPGERPPLGEDGVIDYDTSLPDGGSPDRWTFLALGVGLTLLPCSLLILRYRRRPVAGAGVDAAGLLPDPPHYLARFRRACAQRGRPMPPGRTLRQQLDLLTEDDRRPAFADELLEYHYATTYGEGAASPQQEKQLTRAIRSWGG